jgi:hypothetical protein
LQQLNKEIEKTRALLVENNVVKVPSQQDQNSTLSRQSMILKDPKSTKRIKALNRISRSFESLKHVKDLWSGSSTSMNSLDELSPDKSERSMETIMADISQTGLGNKYSDKEWAFSYDRTSEAILNSPDNKSFDDFAGELGICEYSSIFTYRY